MEYKIEDLIPNALLRALEQEGKSLVHTPEGWITVDSATIQLSNTLPLVNEKLETITELLEDYILRHSLDIEVKKDGRDKETTTETQSAT